MLTTLSFFKSYWKQVIAAIAIAGCLYLGYQKIYSIGYNAANLECIAKFKEYEEKIGTRIEKIEKNTTNMLDNAATADIARQKSFNDILLTIKGKPLYTIKQGKCTPSDDFVRTYNEAINKANE